jgi:hypothetical protein
LPLWENYIQPARPDRAPHGDPLNAICRHTVFIAQKVISFKLVEGGDFAPREAGVYSTYGKFAVVHCE